MDVLWKLMIKLYAEVIKAEEIVNCPHCGRIPLQRRWRKEA